MKLAIIYRPKTPAPLDAMPDMIGGMSAWVEQHAAKMETLYFFAGGGGFGVLDIDDAADAYRLMAEHPFTQYADVEVRPVVDPETALRTLQEVAAARAGG